ncbi:adenosylcobinamide-GDP ribazoletransferase [Paracoccus sp. Z118]|uniref:adenosylcobinamide-GDP ribazoletransferase n=1 Tax=Paracoccus sp. Z118 TaxID=2851017 RepID=UPI001C2C6C87|nr:adenosylcobinamide-GDP ribazoletransferase [Paracoccus sp. Z118]MBV0892711.1 adenosylcobinamide-GDP ribazoletransferase [Paracoccus sp. Z118]
MSHRLAELHLALILLTRVPFGRLRDPVPTLGAAAWAFPLAGLLVGLIAGGVMWAALALGLSPLIAAGVALGAQVVATGALHEDGLADICDGFWGGTSRERRLQIMRDSRIGSYGTVGLILTLGLRWLGLAALAEAQALGAVIAVAMTSRVAPVVLMGSLPPARPDGLGAQGSTMGTKAVLLAALLGGLPMLVVPRGWAALAVAALVVAGLAMVARAKIGGQTGDVLGAAQQVAEIALLLTLGADL